jgi:hypothetical protein
MLRNLLIITTILLYLISSNMALVYLASHKFNIDYIVKFLCIQKDEEENLCGGSCQLKDKLESVDDKSDSEASEKSILLTFILNYHLLTAQTCNELFKYSSLYYITSDEKDLIEASITPETPPPQNS